MLARNSQNDDERALKGKGRAMKARPLKIQPPLIPTSSERGLRAGCGWCSRCRCEVALKRLGDLLFRHRADDLLDYLSILENEKCGNAANVVAAGGIHGLIDIELGHLELARVVMRDFRDRGRQHVTRAAPFRPKVDHDGLRIARRQNFQFKISIVYCQDAISAMFFVLKGLPR